MHLSDRYGLHGLVVYVAILLSLVCVAGGTVVVPPTFEQLVNESDCIVRATVKSVVSEWREKDRQRFIVTKVDLGLFEVINGRPPRTLTLEMPGGQVGNEVMVAQGFSVFQAGQEEILFVQGNGKQVYPLFAAMHGRYPTYRGKDGHAYVLQGNQIPLYHTHEFTSPLDVGGGAVLPSRINSDDATALSPNGFVQQIRAALDGHYRRKS